MVNLLILKYNNYNNRLFKMENSTADYQAVAEEFYTVENVNFDRADGIHAKQTVNFPIGMATPFEGDYLVVNDSNSDEIISRWFIIENYWNNRNQLILSLRRDLMIDFYETYRNQPMFIEKAMVAATDPFIFNYENMRYNQIKTGERLLKDEFGTGWIVGYLPISFKDNTELAGNQKCYLPLQRNESARYSSLNQYPYYKYSQLGGAGLQGRVPIFEPERFYIYAQYTSPETLLEISLTKNGKPTQSYKATQPITFGVGINTKEGTLSGYYTTNISTPASQWYNTMNVWIPQYVQEEGNLKDLYYDDSFAITEEKAKELLAENGKIIRVANQFYQIRATRLTSNEGATREINTNTSLFNALSNVVSKLTEIGGSPTGNASFITRGQDGLISFRIEEISGQVFESTSYIELKEGSNQTLVDAPYKMFAIPFGNTEIFYDENLNSFIQTQETAMRMAMAITNKYQNTLYDLHLVPYSPYQAQTEKTVLIPFDENSFAISSIIATLDVDYTFAYKDEESQEIIGVAFFPSKSKFSFNINATGEETVYPSSNPVEMKVKSETDKFRICSPNYQGQFEFSAVRNYGVSYYQVDCWYKPGLPYIHIAPGFNGLYGGDYDDARGLVCGGDFSLPRIGDAWQQYVINNQNYQNIFDRQIENMEVSRDIAREEQIWGSVLQGIGGTVSGAGSGFLVGGWPGAIAGGVIGAGANVVGGIADYNLAERRHDEAIDYTRDQFSYQLGNIQAIPYSLTKVGAYTNNNKLFPFVEYYTATEIEKEALRSKIKYNGMTVNRIETFDYFKPAGGYIKGKLIRTNGIDDAHVSSELINELNKGVYV